MAFIEGIIRKEMKRRVDEVLKAGAEWNKTAKELTEAINRVIDVADDKTMKGVALAGNKLAKPTNRLAKSFDNYTKTLAKIAEKI